MGRPVPTILLPGKPPPSRNSAIPPQGKYESGLCPLCFSSATQTFVGPDSDHASPARCESGFCSHRFYPMRANFRRTNYKSCPTGEVRKRILFALFLSNACKLSPNQLQVVLHRRGAETDSVRTVFIQCVQTSAAPSSGRAPPARYKSGFCSHCFYPMRANLRRPRFQSRPTGKVRRGAIGLP